MSFPFGGAAKRSYDIFAPCYARIVFFKVFRNEYLKPRVFASHITSPALIARGKGKAVILSMMGKGLALFPMRVTVFI